MTLKWMERAPWFVVAAVALCFVASPALAGSVYSWETEEGTFAFTDDPKRIPALYKDAAVKKTMGKLKDYPRLTPTPPPTGPTYQERMEERLGALRGRDMQRAQMMQASAAQGPMLKMGPLLVPIGSQPQTRMSQNQPFIAEEVQVRDGRHNTSKTIQVIRQGDRVIYAERPMYSDRIPGDVVREQDVIGTTQRFGR